MTVQRKGCDQPVFVLISKCPIRGGVSQLPGHDLKKIAIELEVRLQQPSDEGAGDPKNLNRSPSERVGRSGSTRRKKSLLADNIRLPTGDHRHVQRQDLNLASKDDDHALRRLALGEDLLTVTKIEDPISGNA
jgi:hypothetical protein